jgi:transcription factor C subunit 3
LSTRPRIQVTEETVWQAITGHGVDYKQIPRLEWHLLQGIAPTKHEGILQGDLRRLVGQDKRSVPKRTDFLAAKGYIVKRSIMVRASKTSKLWLAGFAPSIGGEGGEGSQAKDVEMTKEVLTCDLSPVPWHAKWTGADIDVETFAESVISIVKAWGVMRYSDIRLKMGIEELRWQMRVMARLTRSLVDMGIIKYTAATFANSRKVWKDCIKFLRDPTEAEWSKILATGKKTSKYTDLSKDRQPKPFALSLADKTTPQPHGAPAHSGEEGLSGATPRKPVTSGLVGWVPEKPLQQTLYDAVDAAGPQGATNPQISAGTVGYNFRRYIGTMLTNMSMCKQPPHLEKFQLHRKLVRVDKTSAFIYTTNQVSQSPPGQQQSDQSVGAAAEGERQSGMKVAAPPRTDLYGFRAIEGDKLADASTSLSKISRQLQGRHRQHAPSKQPFVDDAAAAQDDVRSPKRRRLGGAHDGLLPPGQVEMLPGKPPGAYIGEPNSLNPNPKRTGRPKRSLVVIFKSDRLKDPAFWKNGVVDARNIDETVLDVQYNGIPGTLCLDRENRTVVFSRNPQPLGKEPLTIQLNDLREQPVIRPVPGCDGNSLVFVTKETGENPSWTFVFLFKDGVTSTGRVDEILRRVKSIANGELFEDNLPDETPSAPDAIATGVFAGVPEPFQAANTPQPAQSTDISASGEAKVATQVELSVPPWKAKGPGKGRAKKGASASSQRPWKCEKCGNSWKNDIGLKYHLTKAQVPCNPDFVAKPAGLVPSKRKPPPTLPPGFEERAEDEAEDVSDDRRRTRQRGIKPPRRWEVKLEHSGAPKFRGLTVDPAYLSRGVGPVARTQTVATSPAQLLRVPQPVAVSAPGNQSHTPNISNAHRKVQSKTSPGKEDVPVVETDTVDEAVGQRAATTFEKALSAAPTQVYNSVDRTLPPETTGIGAHKSAKAVPGTDSQGLPEPGPSRRDTPTHGGATLKDPNASISLVRDLKTEIRLEPAVPLVRPLVGANTPTVLTPHLASSPQHRFAPNEAGVVATLSRVASGELTASNVTTSALEAPSTVIRAHRVENVTSNELQSVGLVSSATSTPVRAPDLSRRRPLPDKPVKRQQDQLDTGPTPFKPANHYAHLSTDSKIRTAQALDIVEYLLQNNGGIFPGDKALFYAVLRIYLKAFSGQMPPSLNNVRVACRRLTTKGKAREIVHAFRTPTGKIITSSMLLAAEIDPNSIVPTVVKRKIQEAYPGVFIPPAFSPSAEELRLLEEFDREPAETAATEATPKTGGKFRGRRDNLEVEIMHAPYYQENPLEVGGQHHSPAVEKAAPAFSIAIEDNSKKRRKRAATQSAAEQGSGRSAKKQKTLGSKLLGLAPTKQKDDETGRDASDDELGDPEPPSSEPEGTNVESSAMDCTPIASAIKAYGLLPTARTGVKRRRRVDTLVKLPDEIGRVRNPGLASLPYFFFTNRYHDYWSRNTYSTHVTFLEPNTRLDDYHATHWFEELGDSSALAEETNSIATDEEEMPSTAQGDAKQVKGYAFVPSLTLKEYSRGRWPKTPPMDIFEESVQMQGWTPSPQQILRDLLPTNINEMASWNKRKHVRIDLFSDAAFTEFCELIDRCEGWELSSKGTEILTFGTLAPEYRFINASPRAAVCQVQPVAPVWEENNHFTMETFPYDAALSLAGDEDEDALLRKPKLDLLGRKPRGRPPGKKVSPKKDRSSEAQEPREKKRMGRKAKRIRLPALEAEREHTAYPQSAEEYMDIHHGVERTPEWNSEHTQLAAFVCVTTLLGGVAKSVDWGIMMRLFPDMSLSHLRKFFGEMNKDRKSTIIDLTQKFQKAFLEGYKKGDLPALDYDNVLAYDWKALTLWTRSLAGDESTLPPSYAELEKRDMIVSDRAHQPRDWRETFWLPARSLYNRYQDSSSQAFATAVDPQPQIEDDDDDNLRVAMSWVRALCVTASHPPEVVSDKWETFRGLPRATISDLIDKSIRILQERLVITKDKNLIVMRLNDRVVKALDKAAQDQKFAEAARFKRRLDKAFRKGKARYRIPYTADDDGLTMALLNLQAHGRVTVETDNKYVPLGYEPFNYETRKFDRKYHHFRLWAVPTQSYVYNTIPEDYDGEENDELAVLLSNIQATPPPLVGSGGELPLWVDFFGAVDEERWRKCLGAVLFIISTRGPMGADAIADQLKCFVPFEVELVLDWADQLGLLEQMTPHAPKCVTEWWWLAVEAQRRRAEQESAPKKKGKGLLDTGMTDDASAPTVAAASRA